MGAMDVGRPWADAMSGGRGAVLATLVQLEAPVTVRTLARHAGLSPQGALRLVNDLAAAGLVRVRPAGRSLMVRLNRDHLAAEPLIALVATRARLVQRLCDELAGWDDLAGAWLFGSAARGDGDRDSDIDLLLVAGRSLDTDRWADQTARLVDRVQAWTGNPVQLVEHNRRSFAALVREGNPLADALRLEGIPLTPKSRRLLRNAA
jgi:predicted nucleotidyltransferase